MGLSLTATTSTYATSPMFFPTKVPIGKKQKEIMQRKIKEKQWLLCASMLMRVSTGLLTMVIRFEWFPL